MWRAFFYAVGVSLILLGVQFLVVDHFVVANGTRVPGFVAKFLNKGGQKLPGVANHQPVINGQSVPQFVNAQSASFRQPGRLASNFNGGGQANTGSRFGPSRFADSQFSNSNLPPNTNYYGGVPSSNFGNNVSGYSVARPGNSNVGNPSAFSLAGYGQVNGAPGPVTQSGGGKRTIPGSGGSRLFDPKDWMPWCLLAVGTLVVLYTNSTGRRFGGDS